MRVARRRVARSMGVERGETRGAGVGVGEGESESDAGSGGGRVAVGVGKGGAFIAGRATAARRSSAAMEMGESDPARPTRRTDRAAGMSSVQEPHSGGGGVRGRRWRRAMPATRPREATDAESAAPRAISGRPMAEATATTPARGRREAKVVRRGEMRAARAET